MTGKKRNRFHKKLLSVLLAACLLAGSLSTSAFAAAPAETTVTTEVTAGVTEEKQQDGSKEASIAADTESDTEPEKVEETEAGELAEEELTDEGAKQEEAGQVTTDETVKPETLSEAENGEAAAAGESDQVETDDATAAGESDQTGTDDAVKQEAAKETEADDAAKQEEAESSDSAKQEEPNKVEFDSTEQQEADGTEETGETEEPKETEAESVPAEVQAFLDAVAALPDVSEISLVNAETIGDQVNAVIDMWDTMDDELTAREDVTAAMDTVYAVFEAVLAAEGVGEAETYYTDPLPGKNAHDIFYDGGSPECYLYLNIHPNNPKESWTNPAENIEIKVGETGSTQRLYTHSHSCRWGHIVHEETPEWIAIEPNKSDYFINSEAGIVEEITWGLKGYVEEDYMDAGYGGYPALEIGFTGAKPGKTTLNFYTWQEYYYYFNAGYGYSYYCDYGHEVGQIVSFNGWVQDEEMINITVEADYVLNYNTNGGTPNIPSQRATVASTQATFSVTNIRPEKTGYKFMGWAETENATVAAYQPNSSIILNWEEGYGSTANPVSKTLYAVWEKDNSEPDETYTVIYTDGVPGEIVFPDQGYEGLKEGDKTPEFVGTPEREGFTFMGWAPAVNPVVSADDADKDGNITYMATWMKDPTIPPKKPDLNITKAVSSSEAKVGDIVTYTIEVENTGDADATNVVITDSLNHDLLEWQSAVASVVGGDIIKSYNREPADGKYVIGIVEAGQKIALVINAKVIAEGTIENTAEVDSDETNPENSEKVTTDSKKYKLTDITKVRLTEVPAEVTLPEGVTINTDDTVKLGTDQSATLLYKITVTGDNGASYKVSDTMNGKTAMHVGGAPMEGKIPEGGKAEIYVIMTFNQSDIAEGKLTNTATLSKNDENTSDPDKSEGSEDAGAGKTYTVTINFKTDTGEELQDPIKDIYDENDSYDYPVTGKPNDGRMLRVRTQSNENVPWSITTADGKTYVVDIVLTSAEELEKLQSAGINDDVVVDLIYSLDEIGSNNPEGTEGGPDGIPDKYQAVVTYRAVNGTVNGVAEYKFVVTLRDENGVYAAAENGGKAELTEAQLPATSANEGYGPNGTWAPEMPVAGTEIIKDTTFVITYDPEIRTTYTVTYTDGVADEEIFPDQITSGLAEGTATPAFEGGIPTREGYTFAGWSPVVTATVTGNAVYTAQWTVNGGSENPTEPVDPTEPENPTEPEAPTEPESPTEPEAPTEPVNPTEPETSAPAPENPTPAPAPAPTPEPAPAPAPAPEDVVPVVVAPVTPVAAAAAPATPAAPAVPETEPETEPEPEVEMEENNLPLAEPEQPAEPETEAPVAEMEIEEEALPLAAAGNGAKWALVNFALMNLAVFESLMLLIGYFVSTKKEKEEDKKLKKKGIMRLISLPVAILAVIAFCLTEDITLPTGFVDRWTLLMAIIAIVQTVAVVLSRKKEEDEAGKVRA